MSCWYIFFRVVSYEDTLTSTVLCNNVNNNFCWWLLSYLSWNSSFYSILLFLYHLFRFHGLHLALGCLIYPFCQDGSLDTTVVPTDYFNFMLNRGDLTEQANKNISNSLQLSWSPPFVSLCSMLFFVLKNILQ